MFSIPKHCYCIQYVVNSAHQNQPQYKRSGQVKDWKIGIVHIHIEGLEQDWLAQCQFKVTGVLDQLSKFTDKIDKSLCRNHMHQAIISTIEEIVVLGLGTWN